MGSTLLCVACPLGFCQDNIDSNVDTHLHSSESISSWITLQNRHGDHALQSCIVYVNLTATSPRRPDMAWVGARGAYYPPNHRWGYHLLPETLCCRR